MPSRGTQTDSSFLKLPETERIMLETPLGTDHGALKIQKARAVNLFVAVRTVRVLR